MTARPSPRPLEHLKPRDREDLSLEQAVTHLLEECRMVLPGVQALFGFQLIAVFNQSFAERLDATEQRLHLAALVLVAMAGALIMTPAAYHRQTNPKAASTRFLVLAGRLLLVSMVPLVAGIGLDVYLIARLVLGTVGWAVAVSSGLVLFFAGCWLLFPQLGRLRAAHR